VPVEVQTPGGDISRSCDAFSGPHVDSVDGTDFFAAAAMREAAPTCARARARRSCTRRRSARTRTRFPTTRSCTRPPRSARSEARRDPITQFAEFLQHNGLAAAAELAAITAEVERESRRGRDRSA
jgi:TPP-dependent pyruvate/acetoin dehydrogenase alpha subunit